jgi:hypothetical protein
MRFSRAVAPPAFCLGFYCASVTMEPGTVKD